MKKILYLVIACFLVGCTGATAPPAAGEGDAAKGKVIFDQQCGLCHDALSTNKKMGPGLKGLYQAPKLSTNGKPVTDANVLEKINTGGNGMSPYRDMLSDAEKANLIAYLKTI